MDAAGGSSRSSSSSRNGRPDERTSLLVKSNNSRRADEQGDIVHVTISHHHHHQERRGSNWSTLSPAVPFVPDIGSLDASTEHTAPTLTTTTTSSPSSQRASTLQTVVFNAMSMLMVCAAGVAGWYLSGGSQRDDNSGGSPSDGSDGESELTFNFWGQVFGYLCAVFYLGSRVPQLLLNWRRQSTDGVSMLFFLFACLGNLTYVLSIFAYDGCSGQNRATCTPEDARARYGRYLLVNLSWLAGSLGTLFLDMCIFVQFFIYRVEGADDDSDYDVEEEGYCDTDVDADFADADSVDNSDEERDERPLLRRNMSSYH